MASGKNRKKKSAARKLPSEKIKQEFDNTVTSAEGKIESLAERLVADGVAKDLTEAQGMVLRDPANGELVKQYEKKFQHQA